MKTLIKNGHFSRYTIYYVNYASIYIIKLNMQTLFSNSDRFRYKLVFKKTAR